MSPKRRGLNRAILDTAPGGWLIMLATKAEEAASRLILVDPRKHRPSQIDPVDGSVRKKALSNRIHVLPDGKEIGRDQAAAWVLWNIGQWMLGEKQARTCLSETEARADPGCALGWSDVAADARFKGQAGLADRGAGGAHEIRSSHPPDHQRAQPVVLPTGAGRLGAVHTRDTARRRRFGHRPVQHRRGRRLRCRPGAVLSERGRPWKDIRRTRRAMDRSRRATNPDNFDAKGRAIKGRRKWNRSARYQALAIRKRERDRRLAAERKRSHGELANRILGQGTTIKTEKLSYKSFQKNFGRSVKVRGPGMMISTLQRKAESAGGGVIEIKTRHTRLSQFDHTTGEYIKKPAVAAGSCVRRRCYETGPA